MSDLKTAIQAPPRPPMHVPQPATLGAIAAVMAIGAAVIWSYWTTLGQLVERWWIDPQYSHGFLVPVFALVILWIKKPAELKWKPNALGLALLAVSIAPRFFAARLDNITLDGLCLIGSLLGLALLVGGMDVLRWTWPAILFLAFMIPLPHAIEDNIAVPLRRLATIVSTYVLQTFGYPALAEGNIIHIEQIPLRVEDACSGLGMLMTFFALATAMAIVVSGPLLDRVILVLSAIPIAVFANVFRITATGMAFYSFGLKDENKEAFHDGLGYLMMPLALLLLWFELKFLRLLLITDDNVTPLNVPLSPWLERAEANGPKTRWS